MVSRRTFVKQSALAAGAATLARSGVAEGASAPKPIGIQIGAVSFVDEGTERVIEGLREMGGVNTLFVATFIYGRGIGGRQPRGSPLPTTASRSTTTTTVAGISRHLTRSCTARRASLPRRRPTIRDTTCSPTSFRPPTGAG